MYKIKFFGLFLMIFTFYINGYAYRSYTNNESRKSRKLVTLVNGYRVVKGERPQIDLDKVPNSAFETGKIQIKLNPNRCKAIIDDIQYAGEKGYVEFSIVSLNKLNQQYKAFKYTPFLSGLYEHSPAMAKNREKHQAWGFHLWFEVEIDTRADVKEVVKAYASLDEVDIAEPIYKTVLYGNVENSSVTPSEKEKTRIENQARWIPNDPRYDEQWHYNNTGQQSGILDKDIDLPEAWEIETGYAEVIVAVIDGGIQHNHPDLQDNMWSGIGYNFVANSGNIEPHNHGTHVAGTISANSNNGIGVSGIAGGTGIGDGVRLMSCQVFTNSSSGGFGQAPIYAADNGAAISQNSWGYQSPNIFDQLSLDAIDYFNENGGGEVLTQGITIFAAGNSNSSGLYYPGCYSGALSVAATNNQDIRSWYSNYDDWVDISAPGGEVDYVNARGVLSCVTGNSYNFNHGTSMACPHVSGVAALLVSYAARNGIVLTSAEVWDLLVENVDDHYPSNPSYQGKLGSGRLNALSAIKSLQDMMTGVMNPQTFSALSLSSSQIELSWTKNAENHNVMLVYSSSSTFGIPDSGMVYTVGDALNDGGIVIYRGSENSFLHSELDAATHYFYRAYSYADNEYSTGKNTNAITFCEAFQLPYYQGFETGLPVCWEQEYVVGNIAWQFGLGNGDSNPVAAYEGSKNAYFKATGYYDDGKMTRLVSPRFNLSSFMNVEVTFHLHNQASSGDQDTLMVMCKNGIDGEWVLIESFSSSLSEWTETVVEIPQELISDDFYLSFLAKSGGGNGVCIDAVLMEGQLLGPYANFIADPRNTLTGLVVNFTDASNGAEFESWEWDFGQDAEPRIANGAGPHSVIYFSPGFKTVTLTVNDSLSRTRLNYVKIDPNPNPTHMVYYAALDANGVVKARVDNIEFTSGAAILAGKNIAFEAIPNSGYKVKSWKHNGTIITDFIENIYVLNQLGATTAVFVEFESSVGFEGQIETLMHVYPNPALQQITIEQNISAPAIVEIISIEGNLMSVFNSSSKKIIVDLHEFPVGIYFIRLVSMNEIKVSKFIKE